MAECPWCHGLVQDAAASCPNCGKLASDLRTTDPPEAMPAPPPKEMAVPDLVIPAAPTSKPSINPAVSSRPAAPIQAPTSSLEDDFALGGGDLQIDLSAVTAKPGIARPPTPGAGFSPFDDDIAAGPSLELDTQGSLPPRFSNAPGIPTPPRSGGSLPSMPLPPISHPALGASAPPPAIATDPFEAKVLADYGPAPDAFWQSPLYAYRVVKRRSELQRARAETKEEAARLTKRVEDALVSLGERARALAKDGGGALTAPMLERVHAADELLRSRDTALAGTTDTHQAALAEIDTRLGAAEAELGRAKGDEAKAQAAFETTDADVKRTDAKLKRIDIEIRNGAAGRSAEREVIAAELVEKTPKRAEAERAVGEARRVVAAAQVRATSVAAERTAQTQRFSRQSNARGAGVDDAQQQLRSALADLGRALLIDASSAGAAAQALAAARDEVARLEEQAQIKNKSLALHESALVSYDAGKVVLGVALVVVAFALVVVLLCFPFIYRAFAT